MIVEDERTIAHIISVMLSTEGYCCAIAATGAEAVEAALRTPPDLMLMEIGLVEATVCERVRAGKDIPVIFVSANGNEKAIDLARRCEPHGYIVEPLKFKRLIHEVKNTLAGRGPGIVQ